MARYSGRVRLSMLPEPLPLLMEPGGVGQLVSMAATRPLRCTGVVDLARRICRVERTPSYAEGFGNFRRASVSLS